MLHKTIEILMLFLLERVFLRHSQQPVHENGRNSVECDKREKNSHVPPPMTVLNTHRIQKLIGSREGAVLAVRYRAGIQQVATRRVHVRIQKLGTILTCGRGKVKNFDGRAFDICLGQSGREHGGDNVGKGRKSIHKDPEAWEDGRGR